MSREIYIDSKIEDIEILAKKAKVLLNDLSQGYFSESVESKEDSWKVMYHFFDHAGTKVDIANDIIFELMKDLSNLRNALIADDNAEKEIKLYELMDKHGCDYDVAELLLQDQKGRNA